MPKHKKSSTAAAAAAATAQPAQPIESAWEKQSIQVPSLATTASAVSASQDSLMEKVNGHASEFPFAIQSTPEFGRFPIATQITAEKSVAGSLLLREKPFVWIVKQQFFDCVCAACGRWLRGCREIPRRNQVVCMKCRQVLYCSAKCQMKHAQLHDLQCEALTEINHIAQECVADPDMIRFLLASIAQIHLSKLSTATAAATATATTSDSATVTAVPASAPPPPPIRCAC